MLHRRYTFFPPMVSVPIERNGHKVVLHARISTPGNASASAIDPERESIVFIHPTWLDGFFFYPQTEDPLFGDFNLVSFDLRGHGLTSTEGRDADYDVWGAAEDIAAGMEAHVVGVSFGAIVALALASRRPTVVVSLILVSLPPTHDTQEMTDGYADCKDAFITAGTTGDLEILDAITTATFEYDAGSLAPVIRDIRDEYMALARQRLQKNITAVYDTAFYIWNPVEKRQPLATADVGSITAPALILQGCDGQDDHTEDAQHFASLFNYIHSDDSAHASLNLISGVGHYMTLTSPNVVNPLIAKFINTPTSAGLPPLPGQGTRIQGPAQPRSPSTPRSTKFELPPIPRKIPGMRTVGDELDVLSIDIEVVSSVI